MTTTFEGERIKKWFRLETENRTVARRKLARILAGDAPTDSGAIETVDAYAKAWLEGRRKRGLASVSNERRYYEHVWKPVIGSLPLNEVRAGALQLTIDDAAEGEILGSNGTRYSRESIVHLRAVILRMLETAWREELIPENVARRTKVPDLEESIKAACGPHRRGAWRARRPPRR